MSQTTNLNMIPQRNVSNLYFSQNDVGRVATVNLVDGGTPYSIPIGATVKIQATKPSGLGFSETCTFSGSTVTVTSTATMTDEAGVFPCEIQVTSGGTILGSANFNFFVERNPHPNGTTDGTAESVVNEITIALNEALEEIDEAKYSGVYGGIKVVSTVAEMTDISLVYLYNGTETGYTSGHWYYYDMGTYLWTDGGQYTGWSTVEDAVELYIQNNAQTIGTFSLVVGSTTYTYDGTQNVSVTLPVYSGGVI